MIRPVEVVETVSEYPLRQQDVPGSCFALQPTWSNKRHAPILSVFGSMRMYHIQQDDQTQLVRFVDQGFQILGSSYMIQRYSAISTVLAH